MCPWFLKSMPVERESKRESFGFSGGVSLFSGDSGGGFLQVRYQT
jgi:hypothetical protein